MSMFSLIIALLITPAPAEERLTLTVTPYAEDLHSWSPARVDEAMSLAAWYLKKCRIDLDWAPIKPLRPGDETDLTTLQRTNRHDELLLLLRAPGDRRAYALSGVANLRRVHGGWVAETAWTNTILALAEVLGRGKLKRWPSPEGADGEASRALAHLAMLYATAQGWITMAPAITEKHCAFLQRRLSHLSKQRPRQAGGRRPLSEKGPQAIHGLTLPRAPQALLMADVPARDAYQAAVKVAATSWRLLTWYPHQVQLHKGVIEVPGEGLALLRVGWMPLFISKNNDAVHITWAHVYARDLKQYRRGRRLKGCARLLAADVVQAGHDLPAQHPGVAMVVCDNRVYQITPLLSHDERVDTLPPMRWATITRWGPGRAQLIAAHPDGVGVYTLWPGHPPQRVKTPEAVAALAALADAPIWQGLGVEPVQLTPNVLRTPTTSRPLGDGARAWFSGHQQRALRLKATASGLSFRSDSLIGGASRQVTLPVGAIWAIQPGDVGPLLWALTLINGRWHLYPAFEPGWSMSVEP
ncbi:hypothetical protein KKF91_12880 [Myxococcota bacterium]|nr:hypothetical protein [Myxococcota bacterium]MBU1431429.1 hypothetical protein [Myxococcota bacterium]MBU1898875.1 hypothetical protein [Myxococcota bacterium]